MWWCIQLPEFIKPSNLSTNLLAFTKRKRQPQAIAFPHLLIEGTSKYMSIIKPLACAVALSFSATALADVSLTIPTNVNLLLANGEQVKQGGGFFSAKNSITLPNGENQIVFRYEPSFTKGGEEVSLASNTIIAKFTATDTQVSFELPQYRSYGVAEKQIDNLKWTLVDGSGKTIATVEDELTKNGMQLGRNYKDEALSYNQAGGKAAITVAAAASVAATSATKAVALQPVAKTSDVASGPADANTAEEMLHFWYKKADKATQERFKNYLNTK